MKKLIILTSLTLVLCFSLIACSTDFSQTINDSSDQIYDTIRDYAEPFLKEDPSYSDGENNQTSESPSESEGETNEN